MAVDYHSFDHNEHKVVEQHEQVDQNEDEDDYIDMEVSSLTHFFPSHNPREFEFQMSSNNVVKESTTSPADELFYKGKLLPLHLPPRLQMVEKLLKDPISLSYIEKSREFYSTPLGTYTTTTPIGNTPFESCNVSPVESCQVSRELNPNEYFKDYANDQDDIKMSFACDLPKKSWSKKLKTKIKSLFGKGNINEQVEKQSKGSKKIPFGQIPRKENDGNKEGKICHRRSFSGAFKRRSSLSTMTNNNLSTSSTSSSSSNDSSSHSNNVLLNDVQPLKRSSSANSEMETSLIQGAIAHCKKSHNAYRMRKTMSEIGVHSLSSARFVDFDDEIRSIELCRG